MDYKELIKRLNNYSVKDKVLFNLQTVKDAAAAIEQLVSKIDELEKQLAEATEERDAAIADMRQNTKCYICKHLPKDNNISHCEHFSGCGLGYIHWEWRGKGE